jgi:VWFA-related protein
MLRTRLFTLLLIAAATVFGQNPGQNSGQNQPPAAGQPQAVLKAHTRLVVVDVVATDSKGVAVTDLSQRDFTLLEDGREQKIATFVFQHPEPGASAPPLPPHTFSNVAERSTNSSNVILLDALNGEFTSRAHALDELVKFLNAGPQIQPTAIYVLEQKLKLLHDFSTDTKSLKEALAGFRPTGGSHVDTVYAAASSFTQRGDFQTRPVNIENTLQALRSLGHILAGRPGRKNVIWLSEAFPVNLFPEIQPQLSSQKPASAAARTGPGAGNVQPPQQPSALSGANDTGMPVGAFSQVRAQGSYGDYEEMVRQVADALMAAQVAIYPIDAAGVGRISRLEAFTTMRTMAERTGGKTFVNQNDLNLSIRSSVDDGSTYYTLAYYPDDKNWDGRFRQIAVKTSRPGVSLHYRLGYYALDPDLESKSHEGTKQLAAEFTSALALDVPSSTSVLFQADVVPPQRSGETTIVHFRVDPRTLGYREKPGGQQADLGCAIAAYTEKGSFVKYQMSNVAGTVKNEDMPRLMNSNFPCQCSIDLKPGRYRLRLGVLDKISKQMGTLSAPVTVP